MLSPIGVQCLDDDVVVRPGEQQPSRRYSRGRASLARMAAVMVALRSVVIRCRNGPFTDLGAGLNTASSASVGREWTPAPDG